MRAFILLGLASAFVGGCAARPSSPTVVVGRSIDRPAPAASALAFTPPVAYGVADELVLDRDGRRQVAYGGYDAVVVSETWVYQDDRQRFGRFGDQSQFERRAVSTRVTIGGR